MLAKLLARERREYNTKNPSAQFIEMLGGSPTKAGVSVNETSALALPTVYACIRVLAESVASLPLVLYRDDGRNKVPAVDHPLYFLMHDQPNSTQTSFVWREGVQAHLAGWGNHCSRIIRGRGRRVMALEPMNPAQVQIDIVNGQKVFRYAGVNGGQAVLPSDEVLHVQGISYDGIKGWSPIRLHREAIGWGLATQQFSSMFFGNGARVSGVLEHPGNVQDPEKVRKEWEALYGGENQNRLAILQQGMKYQNISVSPDDAQFVQTRGLQVAEICRIFNVPPVLVQDFSRATWSNAEHADLAFVKHTLLPWLTRIESALNMSLLTESERGRYFFRFKVQGLLRGDNAGRAAFYHSGITDGWMTRNEARALEDLDPLDGLDEPLTPVSAAQPMNQPADGKQPDGNPPDDAPAEDDSENLQARRIALLAAGRVLARAVSGLRKARIETATPAEFQARAAAVLDDAARYAVSALGVTERDADIWRAGSLGRLAGDEPADVVIDHWIAAGPAALLEQLR